MYRCPITRSEVRGFVVITADEAPGDELDSHTAVTCFACGLTHFVNLKTGKTLSEESE